MKTISLLLTTLLFQAVAFGANPLPEKAIPLQLDGKIVDSKGNAASAEELEAFDYFVFYVSSSACGACKPHSEAMKKLFKKHKAKENVAFIVIGRDLEKKAHDEYMEKSEFPFYNCWWNDIVDLRTHFQAFWYWRGGTPHVYMLSKDGAGVITQFDRKTRELAKTADTISEIEDFLDQL